MDSLLVFIKQYWLYLLFVMMTSYMLGSISFSVIVTGYFKNRQDIRKMGSGNAGMTNVLRCAGTLPAILTSVGDFAKGAIAVLIARYVFSHTAVSGIPTFYIIQYGCYLAGFCCIVGHIYPCFFDFRGGKSVLTSFAMAIMIDWRVGLLSLGVFALVLVAFKMVSLASILSAVSYPVANFIVTSNFGLPGKSFAGSVSYTVITTVASLLFTAIIIYKHGSNIERILSGTENKISISKKIKN